MLNEKVIVPSIEEVRVTDEVNKEIKIKSYILRQNCPKYLALIEEKKLKREEYKNSDDYKQYQSRREASRNNEEHKAQVDIRYESRQLRKKNCPKYQQHSEQRELEREMRKYARGLN